MTSMTPMQRDVLLGRHSLADRADVIRGYTVYSREDVHYLAAIRLGDFLLKTYASVSDSTRE
jgi:hypothetical protein